MIIEDKDFRLTPINESSPMFDLELLHTVKPKGGEPRDEFKLAGYGLPLEAALKRVIAYRLNKEESTVDLSTYLKRYKEIQEEIRNLCTVK